MNTHPDNCLYCESGEPMEHNCEPPIETEIHRDITFTVSLPMLTTDAVDIAAYDYLTDKGIQAVSVSW